MILLLCPIYRYSLFVIHSFLAILMFVFVVTLHVLLVSALELSVRLESESNQIDVLFPIQASLHLCQEKC